MFAFLLLAFFFTVQASQSIVAYGAGLEVTNRNKPNVFTIDATSHHTLEELSFDIKIKGPEGVVANDVTDLHAGKYAVEFTPQIEGHHEIHVLLDGQPIKGSPFEVHVITPEKGRC